MPAVRVIEFANNDGDRLTTSRVRLERRGLTYAITLDFLPLADEEQGAWALTMRTTNGDAVVSGAVLRNRVDVLQGITGDSRPPGAILPYNPATSDDPRRYAFESGGFQLLYLPDGYDPSVFAISSVAG